MKEEERLNGVVDSEFGQGTTTLGSKMEELRMEMMADPIVDSGHEMDREEEELVGKRSVKLEEREQLGDSEISSELLVASEGGSKSQNPSSDMNGGGLQHLSQGTTFLSHLQ